MITYAMVELSTGTIIRIANIGLVSLESAENIRRRSERLENAAMALIGTRGDAAR